MKQKFSTKWKASKQPRKQRKFIANAPLHLKRKMLSSNLSKPLREKHKIRNIELRKGDKVRIMRGKFKKKQGKIIELKTKLLKVYVEGIQVKKTDGSKVNVALRASNLQIIELNLDDKILCIFATGFLMGMAPIALDILGVESLTIGPANSIFTIFEFHSSEEGFEFGFFPMSILAISVIAGLVYAIIKPGNPKKKDVT